MAEQIINPNQKRLQILGDEEISNLYGLPHFSLEEQIEYFALSSREEAALKQLHSIKSRIYGILQLGYFKARHLFFIFNFQAVAVDVRHIQERYFPKFQLVEFGPTKVTRLKQQRIILELNNYRTCNNTERQTLIVKAQQAAKVCGKPIFVFREIMNCLDEQRIIAPGYSFMQDIVGQAIVYEQSRLSTILQNHLTDANINTLNRLLADTSGLYEITRLKREPKDFSFSEVKSEISRGDNIQALYYLAQKLLPELDISGESIKYYASLVTYYTVFRLNRLAQDKVRIYLLCFAYHRYQRVHDNLINSLIYKVRQYIEESKNAAKDLVYEHQIEINQNLQKAGQVLKLFTDDSIAETASFQEVRTKAFEILERPKLILITEQIATETLFDETAFQWEHIDTLAPRFKRNLRPILLTVEFASTSGQTSLMKALDFLKDAYQKERPLTQYPIDTFPTQFIQDSAKDYLYVQEGEDRRLLPNRYEFLVYRQLRNGLESGDIFCHDSVRFRSFEDDLISKQQWENKAALISQAGLTILNQPIQDYLAALEQKLETRILEVNQRISSGENEHIEVNKRSSQGRWTLHTPGIRESTNHPIFSTLKQVEIGAVLHFVNQRCQFMNAFEHLLDRYVKKGSDDRTLIACLIAWGTNMGLGRMGETSDIGYHNLSSTSDNYLRPETLRDANDLISNAIADLPIFKHYDIGEVTHSSSDGQKFESKIKTINARHSPKYFGLKKGIVSYTLVANHVPINAKIIGANEHESHYVFDILFNNTTEVQPEIHSTDTHGANEVNFAILHLFGYQFAPRYRDIYDKVRLSLYGFRHPSHYKEMLLKPVRMLKPKLIVDEWDNFQRIMVSLALKTTTQSIIIGKLSAYARKNKTRQALWEYDNIIKSLYLLEYVDSVTLRQNVNLVLNRGESYHQLRRAVSYANYGKLRYKTEYEQQIWGDCARLLTNCIIYYNASILSGLMTYKNNGDDVAMISLLSKISLVAWQHINFYGRHEFSKKVEFIDIEAIVKQLAKLSIL